MCLRENKTRLTSSAFSNSSLRACNFISFSNCFMSLSRFPSKKSRSLPIIFLYEKEIYVFFADDEYLRKGLLCNHHAVKTLVVFFFSIIDRLMLFDKLGFEQKSLKYRGSFRVINRRSHPHHFEDLRSSRFN